MVVLQISTPQLICRKIMETLLKSQCVYNTRKIIKPHELDIYFPEYKLALEYSGSYWHNNKKSRINDQLKKNKCEELGIALIVVTDDNGDQSETVIKNGIKNHLHLINSITSNSLTDKDVDEVCIKSVYDDIFNITNFEEIEQKISLCSGVKDFKHKHYKEFSVLRNSGNMHMLDYINQRKRDLNKLRENNIEKLRMECSKIHCYEDFKHKHRSLYKKACSLGVLKSITSHMVGANGKYDEEYIKDVSNKYKCFTKFRKENPHMYEILRIDKRLDEFTSHMVRRFKKYKDCSDKILLELARKYKHSSDMKERNCSLAGELMKRDIMNNVKFEYLEENKKEQEKISNMLKDGFSVREIMDYTKYSQALIYKIRKSLMNGG